MAQETEKKEALVNRFRKLIEEDSTPSGTAALIMIFELIVDIRDGLYKDVISGPEEDNHAN